jgi:hypothetical protein
VGEFGGGFISDSFRANKFIIQAHRGNCGDCSIVFNIIETSVRCGKSSRSQLFFATSVLDIISIFIYFLTPFWLILISRLENSLL